MGYISFWSNADDINLLGKTKIAIEIKKKKKETLVNANMEADLQIISEETRSMFMPYHKNAGHNKKRVKTSNIWK
jgi:hypothetical protein